MGTDDPAAGMPSRATTALFDTVRYPLHARGSPAYDAMVAIARQSLETLSCARLADFILPDTIAEMQREAEELAPTAVYTVKKLNPYFSIPPEGTPVDHPVRRFSLRRHGMIRGDRFARDGAIWEVFQNPDLCRFLADCLGQEELHPYRDPYGCVNVNLQPPGCPFDWHFDHNDFTVSIGLEQPVEGGTFEYVPDIRGQDDQNYPGVKAVLDGTRDGVRSLKLRPGDLQLFCGGCAFHRVTAPRKETRMSLLLSYVTDPDHIADPDYALRLWGEMHPLHVARARALQTA